MATTYRRCPTRLNPQELVDTNGQHHLIEQVAAVSRNDLATPEAQGVYSLSSSHSGPSVLRSSYAFARGKPLDPGRLRRPWETSNSPKPSRGFQPEKGRFRPPLSSPLAGSSFATPPAPPGSLSGSDQSGDFPLWTLQGKDHSPSVPAPSQASPTVKDSDPFQQSVLDTKVERPVQNTLQLRRPQTQCRTKHQGL